MTKRILITGASSGIGEGTALYFLEKGWKVAATMRNPDANTSLPEHDNLIKLRLDVTDTESIAQSVSAVEEAFGGVDVVLNNAGYGTAGPFEAATEAQVKRQFDVNVFGVMAVTRAFLPLFKAQKSGLFINVSSIGGLITFPIFSLYHATKWAIEGFSESLSYEVKDFGIQVKILEPGGVKTDFAGRSLDMFDVSKTPEYVPLVERMVSNFSEEREAGYSTPRDMAEVIYTAATDGSNQLRYIAGADAKAMWQARQSMPVGAFMENTRQQMLG